MHSSTASSTSTDAGDSTTDSDDDCATLRGRSTSHSRPSRYNAAVKPSTTDAAKTRRGSVSSGSSGHHRFQPTRITFTRSKSPLPPTQGTNGGDASPSLRKASPAPPRIKQGMSYQQLLPPAFYFSFRTPFSEKVRRFYIDSSKGCEAILLLVSMVFAAKSLANHHSETWTSIGELCLSSLQTPDLNETPHTPPFTGSLRNHRSFYLNHHEQKSIA